MAAHHRASCLDCHGLAPSFMRAAYCMRASLLSRATPQSLAARSATAAYHRIVSVSRALHGSVATASRRRLFARPTVCARRPCPKRRREHGSRGPRPPVAINSCRSRLSRAGVRLGEENERVASSGVRRNLKTTPVRRGLRGRRLDGRAPDAEKLFWARNPSVKPASFSSVVPRAPAGYGSRSRGCRAVRAAYRPVRTRSV